MARMSILGSAIAFAFFVAVISMASSVSGRIGSPASSPVSAETESPASAPLSVQVQSPTPAPVSVQAESPELAPAPASVAGGAFSLPVSVAALYFPAVLYALALLRN